MTESTETSTGRQPKAKAPERPKYQPTGPQMGGPHGGPRPAEKSMNFLPSLKRLLGHLAPERFLLAGAILLAIVGIVMNVVGPVILGAATDVIFAGFLSKQPPDQIPPDIAGRLDIVPGAGVDFARLAQILMLGIGLFAIASLVLWLQGYLVNGAIQR